MNYFVTVSTTKPTDVSPSRIWIEPGSGMVAFKIGKWVNKITGGAISSYTEGTFARTLEDQATEGTRQLGQIWRHSTTRQYWIFLNDWQPLIGGL